MNKLFKTLSILVAIALFAIACSPQAAEAAPAEVTYQAVLGKAISDDNVASFIASNECSSAASQFQLCQEAGVALWVDANQKVNTVYLYTDASNGFAAYRGELPFSIDANDSMAAVEQKLGRPRVEHAPQAGWEPGLPDAGGTPDHFHYWAIYKRFGVTIIYNSPSAYDKTATIHAILVSK